MAPEEFFRQLCRWMVNLCIFYPIFTYVDPDPLSFWIQIRIHKTERNPIIFIQNQILFESSHEITQKLILFTQK